MGALKTVVGFVEETYVDLEIIATLANGIVLKVTMKAPTEFVFDACITLDEKWNFNVEMLVNEKPLIFDCKFEISEMRLTFSYDEESTAIVFKYDFVPLKIPLVNSWKNYLLNKKIDPAFGRYIATLAFRSTTLGDIIANLNHEIFGLMHFKTEIQIHDLKMINEYKVEDDVINTFIIQHPSLEQDVVFTGLMHTEDECLVHLKLSAGTFGDEVIVETFLKKESEMYLLQANLKHASSKLDTVMKITLLNGEVFVKLVLVHNEMYEKNLYFLRDIEEQFLYYTMDCITKVKEAIKELVEKTNDLMTDFTLEKMSLKFEDTFQA